MAPQHLIRNESEGVVYSNIRSLRDQSQFLDVSLFCEDGSRLPAHKIILAAHSDKFKRILGQMSSEFLTPVTHSIFLTGVNKEELSSILDFIYEGEVSVSQADLGRFLSVAEKLHINSLVSDNQYSTSIPVSQQSQELTTVAEASNKKLGVLQEEKSRSEEAIKEEVYLASENQTAFVEDILETQPEDEQSVNTCDLEESHFPDPNNTQTEQKKESKKKDIKMNEAKMDVNNVLIENLKVLGMSKLRKDILKDM